MIYAKSKNKILVDPVRGLEGYAVANLKMFDITDNTYTIEYGYVYDNEGSNEYARLFKTKRSKFENAEVDAMFQAVGNSISVLDSFTSEIREILKQALIIKLVSDGRFGLSAEEWKTVENALE